MDSTALNYNPLANVDDGSCITIVNGCTDSTAANYNPLANVDDGSCHFCFGGTFYVTIDCGGGSWQSEVSWNLLDDNGAIILSGGSPYLDTICLDDGCYILNMYDSFGDGWNGSVFSITDNAGNTMSAGLASGASGTANMNAAWLGCYVYGCTDPLAIN